MTSSPPLGSTVIVVIDDNDPFLDLMREVLDAEGYHAITGSVAGDALSLIREHFPALVILDLVMETQEAGLDVLREMRAEADTAHMPVLIMTASHDFVRDRAGEFRDAHTAVMEKPFGLDDLLQHVTALIPAPETSPQRRTDR